MGTANCKRESQWIAPKQQVPIRTRRNAEAFTPRIDPAVALRQTMGAPASPVRPADILALQRSIGNRAVQRLLASRLGQEPRDANGVAAGADIAVDRAGASSGQALPGEIRGRFENSLGADLSGVRVHTGSESAEAATAVGAKAYTVGQDIHFGKGFYAPGDPAGVHLLAHEVAHTVQNQGTVAARLSTLEVSSPADTAEVEADRAADAMVAHTAAGVHQDDQSRVGRVALSSVPKTIARGELKTNGGSFKIDDYVERDTDKDNNPDLKRVGANIEITFTPAESVTSDKISFVQIMKTTKDDTPYLFENEKPRATDAASGDAGWAVDRLKGKKSANYAQDNDGSAGGNTRFGHRKSKTDVADAWMHDDISLSRTKGQKMAVNATSFALDNTGGKYLGGVTWGFTTDATGKTVKKAEAIQSMGDPGGVQKSALEKWNEQADLADTSKRNAPDQEKVKVP